MELEQENLTATCIKPDGTELVEHINAFLAHLERRNRTPSTVYHYLQSLQYWLRFMRQEGLSELVDFTAKRAPAYQAWLYEYQSQRGGPLAVNYQSSILCNLKRFYRYLLKEGHVYGDPTEAITPPRKSRDVPGNVLTPKEVKKILKQADTYTLLGFRDRTILEVLYSSGLRVSEACRLNVQDLSLPSSPVETTGTIRVHGKGNKLRIVPLGETACRYLKVYLGKVRPLLARGRKHDAVFLSKRCTRLARGSVISRIHCLAKQAGIRKQVTVHSFRHTLATEMLKHGADIRQVQEMLGHGSIKTTQLYTHIVKGELKRIQQKCHPREQTDLPEMAVKYRGRDYLTQYDPL